MQVPSKESSINQIVSNFHDMVSSHAPTQIGLGVVLQEPPELQIAWNNIIIEPAQIYISDFLLLGYTRNYKGKWQAEQMKGTIKTQTNSRKGGGGDPAFRSHTHKVNDDYKASDNEAEYKESAVSMDYGLKAGDIVTMLPINNAQQFIVLSRLVYLPEYVPPEENE